MIGLVDTFVCVAFLTSGEPVAVMHGDNPSIFGQDHLLLNETLLSQQETNQLNLSNDQYVTDFQSLIEMFDTIMPRLSNNEYAGEEMWVNGHEQIQRLQAMVAITDTITGGRGHVCQPPQITS